MSFTIPAFRNSGKLLRVNDFVILLSDFSGPSYAEILDQFETYSKTFNERKRRLRGNVDIAFDGSYRRADTTFTRGTLCYAFSDVQFFSSHAYLSLKPSTAAFNSPLNENVVFPFPKGQVIKVHVNDLLNNCYIFWHDLSNR